MTESYGCLRKHPPKRGKPENACLETGMSAFSYSPLSAFLVACLLLSSSRPAILHPAAPWLLSTASRVISEHCGSSNYLSKIIKAEHVKVKRVINGDEQNFKN